MVRFDRSFFLITFLLLLTTFHTRLTRPWNIMDHLQHCSDNRMRAIRTKANVILGGFFPVHALYNDAEKHYFHLNLYAVTWVEAMMFAVDEINNNTNLLENFSLGFDIRDTCNEVPKALMETLEFLLDVPSVKEGNVRESTEENASICKCTNNTPHISAVIGGAASPISTNVATVLGVDKIPQISYSSTSALLSDKQSYPSFLRTIPSDLYQAKAIADLLVAFGWNYVSVIASDNTYGRSGMDALRSELKLRRICTAVEAVFHPSLVKKELDRIIALLKETSRASTIVLWCQRPNAVGFLQEVTKQNLKERNWIGTETWGDAYQIQELDSETVRGMIGIVPWLEKNDRFEKHIVQLNPQNSGHNPWMKEYWEDEFACSWKALNDSFLINSTVLKEQYYIYSDIAENLTILCPKQKGLPTASKLPRNKYTNVIDAVYAVAMGIDNMLKCKDGSELLEDKKCPQTKPFIKPSELLLYIRNVSFVGHSGNRVMFSDDGDPIHGSYAIKNLQQDNKNGKMKFVEIGVWNGNTRRLKLFDNISIHWNIETSEGPPHSRCEDICSPGEYVVNGSNPCCWTCVPCVSGFVKPTRGQLPCTQCPIGYDSNIKRTRCIKLSEEYLRFSSSMSIVVIILGVIGIVATGVFITIFIVNRETAIVKASNRELSYLHLASILVIFTIPFSVIGKPTAAMCALVPFLFSIPFSLCISITLLKPNRLLRIFQSRTRLTSTRSSLLTNKMQFVRAVALSCLPLVIATVWTVVRPSAVDIITEEVTEKRIIYQCAKTTDTLLITLLVFVLLLALSGMFFAYKARKLPENFNEAKFIGFAMFGFCLCWLSFIPTYYDTRGGNRTFIFAITVFLSGFCVLSIMYFPKIRVMICFPEENCPDVFRSNFALTNAAASLRTNPVVVKKLAARPANFHRLPGLNLKQAKLDSQSAVNLGRLTVPQRLLSQVL